MEEMVIFWQFYGWQIALIALVGIVILGILKYANAFSKVSEENRKPIYFAISVGFSIVATVIYLAAIKQLNADYVVTVSIAMYALNQTMYSIYETTKLRDLLSKLFALIAEKIKQRKGVKDDEDVQNGSKSN